METTDATTFAELGVCPELCASLVEAGIGEPFPIQRLTIAAALAGRDVSGKAKTGSGKTLAFGLPILQLVRKADSRRPHAIVLVPTRELALQVHDVLAPLAKAVGRAVVAIYGGARMEDQVAQLHAGGDVIVATPGRMIDLIERREVSVADIDHVVVDEADRMADMGFLPQVEWILRHVEGRHQTLLFSATLDGAVKVLVDRYQADPVRYEVGSDRPTVDQMHHLFLKVHQMDRAKVIQVIAQGARRTLVFTNTKRAADRLTADLKALGVGAAAIHGDLHQRSREKALATFSEGKLPVLVATDVAARGLHIDEVDVVVHADIADDHKTYLHRSGRTARAGESGVAVSLLLWNEEMPAKLLQKRIGLKLPFIEIFSNDPRLADLPAFARAVESGAEG